MPGIDDLVVAAGQDEHSMICWVGVRDDPAQHRPLAGIDPAREGPAAGNDVAAIDRARLARREDQRGGDQHVRVRPPDFVLHLRLEQREHPVVGEQIGQVPGAGRAGTGDNGAEIDENAVIELRTADAGRLEHAEEPVLVERGLGLGRETPQRLRRSGAFAQTRQQSFGPLQNRVSRIGTLGIRGNPRARHPDDPSSCFRSRFRPLSWKSPRAGFGSMPLCGDWHCRASRFAGRGRRGPPPAQARSCDRWSE